jgi:hypothetical protein
MISTREELDYRVSDGIEVSLLWDRDTNEVVVAVVDTRLGDAFEVPVEPEQSALDVFRHPFAYQATRPLVAA